MIKLGPRPERPKFFESEKFAHFVGELWSFQSRGGTAGTQRHFSWREYVDAFMPEAMSALMDYFRGKCAYTEEPLADIGNGQLVLHRPSSDAIGMDGTSSPEHYWWLIPVWSNWYLASGRAARVKETRFPVDGERTPVPHERADEYEIDERSLLLDPCRDDPIWYLQFWRTGVVGACDLELGKAWPSRRLPSTLPHPGIQTILTLDLNHDALVEARKGAARKAGKALKELLFSEQDPAVSEELLATDQPYAAAVRQAAALGLLGRLNIKASPSEENLNLPAVEALVEELWAEIAVAVICPQGKPLRFAPVEAELLADRVAPRLAETKGAEIEARFLNRLGLGPLARADDQVEPTARGVPAAEAETIEFQQPVIDRSAQIKALHIQNFKAIRDVRVDTADLESNEMSVVLEPSWGTDELLIPTARRWWTFLGENGSGKSSILQAIALALAGKDIKDLMKECELVWKDLHRRPPEGSQEEIPEGRICLDFTNGVRIDLRFDAQRHWWVPDTRDLPGNAPRPPPEAGIPDIQTFVRGYGATRLLESAREKSRKKLGTEDPRNVRIANLFDPRASVIDAEKWLVEDLSAAEFNVAAPTIAHLLEDLRADASPAEATAGDEPQWLLTIKDGRVLVEGLPLRLVSDGYRAIVAMVCDIMAGLGADVSSMLSATGIVLIDEIGAHLHPRWRMSITRKLRRALPQVQFIVSTHEPLCLRGLVAKEVVRVQKHPDYGVTVEVVERSPSNYRVDQLLTSEFFGLETTIDPDIERRFHHYYQLLAIPESERDEEEQKKFEKLRDFLYKHAKPYFGFTRRDQLVCDEIDQFFSQEYQQRPSGQSQEDFLADRKARRQKTIEKIQDIWHLRSAVHGLEDEP